MAASTLAADADIRSAQRTQAAPTCMAPIVHALLTKPSLPTRPNSTFNIQQHIFWQDIKQTLTQILVLLSAIGSPFFTGAQTCSMPA